MKGILLSGIPELFILAAAFILGDGERLCAVFIAAVIHELGHMITAKMLGVKLRLCRADAAGISLKYDFSAVPHIKEAIISAAGPFLGLLSFFICYKTGYTSYFAGASAALSLFNLLPSSLLDGGCILSALLSYILPPDTVWRICRITSVISALFLWCTAVFVMLRTDGDMSVMIVSIYLIYRLFSEY